MGGLRNAAVWRKDVERHIQGIDIMLGFVRGLALVLAPLWSSWKELDHWLERLAALSDDELEDLVPLFNARSHAQAALEAMRMCTALVRPGHALGKRFAYSRDEFVAYAFRLRTLAAFVETREPRRGRHMPLTLDDWCRMMLERYADEHDDEAADLVTWCTAMIDRFGPRADELTEEMT